MNTVIPPAPAPFSQLMPLETKLVACFNRMDHPAADTTKTCWFIGCLGQCNIPNTVDLEFIKHPDYPSLYMVSHGWLVVSKQTASVESTISRYTTLVFRKVLSVQRTQLAGIGLVLLGWQPPSLAPLISVTSDHP